jgi:hypothetical protein
LAVHARPSKEKLAVSKRQSIFAKILVNFNGFDNESKNTTTHAKYVRSIHKMAGAGFVTRFDRGHTVLLFLHHLIPLFQMCVCVDGAVRREASCVATRAHKLPAMVRRDN